MIIFPKGALPKTKMSPEKGTSLKGICIFQPSIFRGYVSSRGGKGEKFNKIFQTITSLIPGKTTSVSTKSVITGVIISPTQTMH